MDPIANLEQQLERAHDLVSGNHDDHRDAAADGRGLAELVLALDEWRRKGGFDPYRPPTVDQLKHIATDLYEHAHVRNDQVVHDLAAAVDGLADELAGASHSASMLDTAPPDPTPRKLPNYGALRPPTTP